MDQGKVQAISNWPRPQTVKELQCFLSFANFYHRFIQHFSHLTASLTSLLRKKHKSLSWNPEALTSFENLKQIFCLLHFSDPHSPRSSPPICCGSGCFYHQGRSGVITVSRRASYPPSMRLLFEEAYPSRAELWHRQQRVTIHQASPGGMVALAGGSPTSIHCHNRSSKSWISPECQKTQCMSSPMGLHHNLLAWIEEHQGGYTFLSSPTWQSIDSWAHTLSSHNRQS